MHENTGADETAELQMCTNPIFSLLGFFLPLFLFGFGLLVRVGCGEFVRVGILVRVGRGELVRVVGGKWCVRWHAGEWDEKKARVREGAEKGRRRNV